VDAKLASFQPELIILSAGFDAHKDDPSKGARLTTDDFYDLTQLFLALAWRIESCHGRLMSVLEGGYNVQVTQGALQRSVEAHLRALSYAPKAATGPGAKRKARS
jgi:acetoin utilization deacetylase AcuC-like enzyme